MKGPAMLYRRADPFHRFYDFQGCTVKKNSILAAVIILSACSSQTPHSNTATPATPSPSSSPPPTPSAIAPSPISPTEKSLTIPSEAILIVQLKSGKEDYTLPSFASRNQTYTIFNRCTGSGTITFSINGEDETPHKCKGVPSADVFSVERGERQRIRLKVKGKVSWELAVAEGTPPWFKVGDPTNQEA
jgi:hypothetical protein